MSAKHFKAIALVVVLVDMTKSCKWFLSNSCIVKSLQVTAAQMIIYHSINFFQFKIPSKWSTFNKRIVSEKNFKAISSVVYSVGMTKDFECFLAILSSVTPLDSAYTFPNFRLR